MLRCKDFFLIAAPGLSYPAACGILVPSLGIKPVSPALESGFLITGPPGTSATNILRARKLRHREAKQCQETG